MNQKADPSSFTGRTFRIQFRAEADLGRGICSGRVEHIRSGDAAHFGSAQELMAFVELCLSRQPMDPPP
jgi:hypothetical protein